LLFGGQLSGVVLSVVFSFIFDGESIVLTRLLNGFMIILLVFALLTATFAEEILKREDYEDEQERQ
jgi:RsiW-degrading membrane proteinase PrsW (M82 family)